MVDVHKKGLKFLKKRVASRKEQLEADLKAGKSISAEDEEWLDGAGNLIDEERVVEVLDNVSDYKDGLDSKVQRENAAANNISDNDVDDDAPIELPPSRHQALQAKATIEKYIAASDEPYARKLESVLADFARSTRLIEAQKMKVSLLTDYFARK